MSATDDVERGLVKEFTAVVRKAAENAVAGLLYDTIAAMESEIYSRLEAIERRLARSKAVPAVNRDERHWPAVRAAVEARMRELRLTTAELARRARMSETTVRAFRKGRSRPYGFTLTGLNEGLGLPRGYLHAVAEGRPPENRPVPAVLAHLIRLEDKLDELLKLVRDSAPAPVISAREWAARGGRTAIPAGLRLWPMVLTDLRGSQPLTS